MHIVTQYIYNVSLAYYCSRHNTITILTATDNYPLLLYWSKSKSCQTPPHGSMVTLLLHKRPSYRIRTKMTEMLTDLCRESLLENAGDIVVYKIVRRCLA